MAKKRKSKRRQSRGSVKRTPLDAAVSDLVRERADWTCENCGLVDPDGQAKGKSSVMDCSHVNKRRHYSVRFYLDNCFCLCKKCHDYFETRPLEHADFARRKLGEGAYEILREKTNTPYSWTPSDKEEAKIHYRQEFKRIRALRMEGIQGHVHAVNFQ